MTVVLINLHNSYVGQFTFHISCILNHFSRPLKQFWFSKGSKNRFTSCCFFNSPHFSVPKPVAPIPKAEKENIATDTKVSQRKSAPEKKKEKMEKIERVEERERYNSAPEYISDHTLRDLMEQQPDLRVSKDFRDFISKDFLLLHQTPFLTPLHVILIVVPNPAPLDPVLS